MYPWFTASLISLEILPEEESFSPKRARRDELVICSPWTCLSPLHFFGECCIMLYVKEYIFRGRRRARGKERRITLLVTLCAAVILLVAADLISKAAAVSVLSQTGGALEFIPGLIRFEYHKNTGMAWGLFSNATWVFVAITIVTGGLIVFILVKTLKTMPRNLQLGLALVLSGAIGNLIDRVALGYVRDFIAFDFMNFPVFNFADSCITVGAVLLIVSVLFTKSGRAYFAALDEKKQKPEKTDGEKTADCAAGNGGEAGAEPDVKQAESK